MSTFTSPLSVGARSVRIDRCSVVIESLLRVIINVKSSMVSGRQAAKAAAALPQEVGMRSQSYPYLLGEVAILAGVAVLAFSCTPTDLLKT
jgi:hypothetical protein